MSFKFSNNVLGIKPINEDQLPHKMESIVFQTGFSFFSYLLKLYSKTPNFSFFCDVFNVMSWRQERFFVDIEWLRLYMRKYISIKMYFFSKLYLHFFKFNATGLMACITSYFGFISETPLPGKYYLNRTASIRWTYYWSDLPFHFAQNYDIIWAKRWWIEIGEQIEIVSFRDIAPPATDIFTYSNRTQI